jgi:hypothetical protein
MSAKFGEMSPHPKEGGRTRKKDSNYIKHY